MNTPLASGRRPAPAGDRLAARIRAGFTLVELMIVIAIIGILATLAFVVLSKSIKTARAAVERQTVISFRNAVDSFKQDFGFLPPLVNDTDPINPATHSPRIRDDAFLRSATTPSTPRYSVYSLSYYIFGVLGVQEDGVQGPGFTEPQPDGSFSRRGREYPARMDVSADPYRVKRNPNNDAEVVYVDRWGVAGTVSAGWPAVNPIRYYRWLPAFGPDGHVVQYLTPRAVGDPNLNPALRDAQYAIVSVGPDMQTEEGKPVAMNGSPVDGRVTPGPIKTQFTADDIVEVGR